MADARIECASTWNVEYAAPDRLDGLRSVLSFHAADIWVLTETHDDLVPAGLAHSASTEQRPIAENPSGVRTQSRWTTIWSRYPILQRISMSDPFRDVATLLDIGWGQRMLVCGTVLPWRGDAGRFNFDEHHRIIPLRCAEWRRLGAEFPEAVMCIAGDFNTDMATGGHYGTKAGIQDLRDGLENCDLYCATQKPGGVSKSVAIPLIDHIALPKSLGARTRVIATWAADPLLSDNSGVVVEVADPS